jgi:D-aminoacyl-tRNA deacylase
MQFMRAVIQRVDHATVEIDGKVHTSIQMGLLVLLGIEEPDDEHDIEWLAGKIARLRIFDDGEGVMNHSVQDIQGEIMVISQFTLHASTKKGNRPSYIFAAKPDIAIPQYEKFIAALKKQSNCAVVSGVFGAMMNITLCNNGPVTIIIDSKIKW